MFKSKMTIPYQSWRFPERGVPLNPPYSEEFSLINHPCWAIPHFGKPPCPRIPGIPGSLATISDGTAGRKAHQSLRCFMENPLGKPHFFVDFLGVIWSFRGGESFLNTWIPKIDLMENPRIPWMIQGLARILGNPHMVLLNPWFRLGCENIRGKGPMVCTSGLATIGQLIPPSPEKLYHPEPKIPF